MTDADFIDKELIPAIEQRLASLNTQQFQNRKNKFLEASCVNQRISLEFVLNMIHKRKSNG